ncbi:MAG: hypothetical protein ACE5IR_14920 [bacterium]
MKKGQLQTRRTSIFLSALIVLSFGAGLIAQELTLKETEAEFARLEATIKEVQTQRETLSQQVHALLDEIQKLKSTDGLSYFERQRLDELLKRSQALSLQVETKDRELRDLKRAFRKSGEKLIALFDSEIEKKLVRSTNSRLSAETQKTLLTEIENLRAKKTKINRKIGSQTSKQLGLTRVAIEADDSSKKIAQKADLLKDQEDKLRQFAERIDLQKKDLQKELRVRTRINEMVTDISVFDQQEEALGDVSDLKTRSLAATEGDNLDVGVTPEERSALSDDQFLIGKNFDITNISSELLEDAIEILEKRQQQVRAQADSLAKQANRFYKAAQDKKKQ